MPNKDRPLTLEEFTGPEGPLGFRRGRCGNFFYHFLGGATGSHARSTSVAFITCMRQEPEKFQPLYDQLFARKDYETLAYMRLLYAAYRLMREYAESDAELYVVQAVAA